MFAYQMFKDFGFGLTGWAIIVWLLWKIATNHLHHIAVDIKTISADVKTVIKQQADDKKELNEKIEAVDSKVNSLGERTAKLEGQVQ
jgi:hypothetical protein